MKKLLLFLALALPMFAFTSCDDDDKTPNVDITVQFTGVTLVDNTLYVVKDSSFSVASVTLTDNNNKGAVIGGVEYFWDYYRVDGTVVPPYTLEINTQGIPAGTHYLQLTASIFAVDYEPCTGYVAYKVVIVNSEADIPTTGDVTTDPAVQADIRENGDTTSD